MHVVRLDERGDDVRYGGKTYRRHPSPEYRGLVRLLPTGYWSIQTRGKLVALRHTNQRKAEADYHQWLSDPEAFEAKRTWEGRRVNRGGQLKSRYREAANVYASWCRSNTSARYQKQADFVLRDAARFFPQDLRSASADHAREYMDYVSASGIAPSTQATRYDVLSTWFRFCVERGLARANPMRHLRRPKTTTGGCLARATVLTDEEVARLFPDDILSRATVTALYATGMRLGELYRVYPQDIRAFEGSQGQPAMSLLVRAGKTGRHRIVPIPSAACLEALLRLSIADIPKRWERAFATEAEARLGRRVTVYSLRHSRITHWINQGFAAMQVATWAGNSVGVIQRHYWHPGVRHA